MTRKLKFENVREFMNDPVHVQYTRLLSNLSLGPEMKVSNYGTERQRTEIAYMLFKLCLIFSILLSANWRKTEH